MPLPPSTHKAIMMKFKDLGLRRPLISKSANSGAGQTGTFTHLTVPAWESSTPCDLLQHLLPWETQRAGGLFKYLSPSETRNRPVSTALPTTENLTTKQEVWPNSGLEPTVAPCWPPYAPGHLSAQGTCPRLCSHHGFPERKEAVRSSHFLEDHTLPSSFICQCFDAPPSPTFQFPLQHPIVRKVPERER